MSGQIQTTNVTSLQIATPDNFMDGWRGGTKDLQDFIGRLLFAADSGGGVIRGFEASEGAALRSDVTVGTAIIYDGSPPAKVSPWGFVATDAVMQATHDAHHATLERYDLLTITAVAEPTDFETILMAGNGTQSRATRHGTTVTLHITKGTPNVSPTPPATPVGHHLLYFVYVPAGSGALEYYDQRTYAAGPRNRSADPIDFHTESDASGSVSVARVLAHQIVNGGPASFTSSALSWSMVADRPTCRPFRDVSTPVMWYMLAPDRKWKRSAAWVRATLAPVPGTLDFDTAASPRKLTIQRTGTGGGLAVAEVEIQADARRLTVLASKVRYEVVTPVDSPTLFTVQLVRVEPDGTVTAIGSRALTNTAAGVVDAALTMGSTPVIEDGDYLMGVFALQVGAGAAAGEVVLHSIDAQFQEG